MVERLGDRRPAVVEAVHFNDSLLTGSPDNISNIPEVSTPIEAVRDLNIKHTPKEDPHRDIRGAPVCREASSSAPEVIGTDAIVAREEACVFRIIEVDILGPCPVDVIKVKARVTGRSRRTPVWIWIQVEAVEGGEIPSRRVRVEEVQIDVAPVIV